jgi:hypothetical protein
MFVDLRRDFNNLKKLSTDKKQIQDILELLKACEANIHLYLKFYGD